MTDMTTEQTKYRECYTYKNYSTISYCPRCLYDVEEDEGYLEWNHWEYCPYCGTKLVYVPLEDRPNDLQEWIESQRWLYDRPTKM